LYLSRKVSAAKEKLLFLVTYVMKLLVNFVNVCLRQGSPGQVAPAEKVIRICRYGTLVKNTGKPRSGNYQEDSKPGLVDPSDPQFSQSIDGTNSLSSKSLGFQH
jgi:hypothetical protein